MMIVSVRGFGTSINGFHQLLAAAMNERLSISPLIVICIFTSWVAVAGLPAPQVVAQSTADGKEVQTAIAERQGDDSDDVITLECEARIQQRLDQDLEPFYFALIEIPTLEAAKKYKLNIKLINPTDTPIRFARVSTDCGCSKFEVDTDQIPPLGIGQFVMRLEVPNRTVSNRVQLGARFSTQESRKAVLVITVAYELTSSFNFATDRVEIRIPKQENLVVTRVPVIVVPPLTIDQLELKTTENLRDLSVKLVGDDPESEGPYVEITAAGKSVDRREILGEVILRRPGTNHAAGTIVSVRHEESFTIRPESLRLRRDNHSKPFEATAVLRVSTPDKASGEHAGTSETETSEKADEESRRLASPPQVGLTIDGNPARVHLQRLGRAGIYRVTVRYDGPLENESDDTFKVRWRVIIDGEESVIDSHAFVPTIHKS